MRNSAQKVVDIAAREYRSTALTKAFLFGTILVPLILWGLITLLVPLFDSPDKALKGSIAVIDRTDPSRPIAAALETRFDPDTLRAEHESQRAALRATIDNEDMPAGARAAAARALRKLPVAPHDVPIERLPDDANVDANTEKISRGELLALLVVGEDAVQPGGGYELFVGRDLDVERTGDLRRVVNQAIIDARVSRRGYDPADVNALVTTPAANVRTVTDKGVTDANPMLQFLIPIAFMVLLWIAVFSSGQYLLTTTIEEKSSRVMELLLSAASPMQLMTGKIIGQAMVGLTILVIYAGLGVAAADRFGMLALVPTEKLPWLALYFIMGYFLIGSFMAAIGSAVNEMREAQSLMGTVMIVMMIPFFLWSLIIRQPNSTFSTVASFLPPLTPFVMILRLSQTAEPIPVWQVVATTVIGFVAVYIAVWASAKIFRVGVLMYGKPPTPLTLLKWLRYA